MNMSQLLCAQHADCTQTDSCITRQQLDSFTHAESHTSMPSVKHYTETAARSETCTREHGAKQSQGALYRERVKERQASQHGDDALVPFSALQHKRLASKHVDVQHVSIHTTMKAACECLESCKVCTLCLGSMS